MMTNDDAGRIDKATALVVQLNRRISANQVQFVEQQSPESASSYMEGREMTLGPRIDRQQVTTIYTDRTKCEALVNELNSTEDACGWTYNMAETQRGFIIQIRDEDNIYLGTL